MTDSTLLPAELEALERLIDHHGIAEILIALSEICGAKADHIRANWQDRPLARRWQTLEGAIGVAVPKGAGL
jgi:hypothetical protein